MSEPGHATNQSLAVKNEPTPTTEARLEDELILCCARLRLDPEAVARLGTLVREGLDWDYLLRSASRHGLIPLLYRHLSATGLDTIPGDFLIRLRNRAQENTAWCMLLTSKLLNILSIFQTEGISAIPFRGPTLADFVYGNLALREFNDLDVLIRREDFPRVRQILVARGYRPYPSLDPARESAYLTSHYDYEFIQDDTGIVVELHWEIAPRYLLAPLDRQIWWQGLEHHTLAGEPIHCLSAENLLLVVCIHSTKHLWQRLAWICDVAAIIDTHRGMDWEKVIGLATQTGTERMLLLGLFLAADLLQAPLPEAISQRLQADGVVRRLARQVRTRLFKERSGGQEVMASIPFHLKVRKGLWNKFLYCCHMTFTPTPEDWALFTLPPSLFFLYYLARPFRLLEKYIISSARKA